MAEHRLRNFTILFTTVPLHSVRSLFLSLSFYFFFFFYVVRQPALGNEYLWGASPRPGVPARKPPCTEFTALPPQFAPSYKVTNLQYYRAVPRVCTSRFPWMRTWRTWCAVAPCFVHEAWIRARRILYTSRDTYEHWFTPSDLEARKLPILRRGRWSDVYQRGGFGRWISSVSGNSYEGD